MRQTVMHSQDRRRLPVWGILCVLLIAVFATAAFSIEPYAETPAEIATPTVAPTAVASSYVTFLPLLMRNHQHPYTVLERMGFCAAYGAASDYPALGGLYGLYADYSYRMTLPDIGDAEYVQMIMVRESIYGADPLGDPTYLSQAQAAAAANPGSLWIIGNEPECPYGQGARTPEQYAVIYHTCYTELKEADLTARVAVGGVVEPTALRLEWLDRVLAEYERLYGVAMPVDVWTVHNQILQEVEGQSGAGIPVGLDAEQGETYQWWNQDDMDIFENHMLTFRQWMADNGYRECELIVSEFGFLNPQEWFGAEGEAIMADFMETSYRYMLSATDAAIGCPTDGNLLVQRWLWYSMAHPGEDYRDDPNVDDSEIFGGALYDPFTHLSYPLGQFYIDMVPRLIAEFGS